MESREHLSPTQDERDVANSKRAEELLLSRDDVWERTLDAISDWVLMIDLDGRILRSNRSGESLTGVPVSEMLGQSCCKLLHGSDERFPGCPIQEMLRTRERVRVELQLPDGGRWLIVTVDPVFDEQGEIVAVTHICRDVTERKQTEKALRAIEERLNLAIAATNLGPWDWDLQTNEVIFSAEWKRQIGYEEHEIANVYQERESRLHPDDRERVLEALGTYLDSRDPEYDVEFRLRHKDGSYRWIYTRGILQRDASDKPFRMLGCHMDITERKQTQEALEREHRALRQMLQAQDQERRLAAYDIHDELAQYLTAAMMQFQTCVQLNSGDAEASHGAGLRMLEKALSEARRLISGLRPPILDESGVVAAIGHLINEVRAQEGPEVEFHSSVTFDRLERTLENSIYRIVQEGLANAHRHAKAGHVRIELTQEDDTVRILVEDQGIGFEPENVGERRYGLAGIWERARVLGGIAAIESAPGKGTRIKVVLPLVATG